LSFEPVEPAQATIQATSVRGFVVSAGGKILVTVRAR
jgi:hypothetical protein